VKRHPSRTVLVLVTIGTFVSARQIGARHSEAGPVRDDQAGSVESVFHKHDGLVDLSALAGKITSMPRTAMRGAPADTLEIYEIELQPEGDKSVNVKKLAAYLIVAAFVGYALYLFLDPGEKTNADGGGKDIPDGPYLKVPLNR